MLKIIVKKTLNIMVTCPECKEECIFNSLKKWTSFLAFCDQCGYIFPDIETITREETTVKEVQNNILAKLLFHTQDVCDFY